MDSGCAHRHLARIIGTGVIVGVAGLAVGPRAVDLWQNALNDPRQVKVRPEHPSPAKPVLKPVPREQFPLSLANEPTDRRPGVINADHKELDSARPERAAWRNPVPAESSRIGKPVRIQ